MSVLFAGSQGPLTLCHKIDAHTRKNVVSNTLFDIPEKRPNKNMRHIIAIEELLNTRDINRGKNFTIKWWIIHKNKRHTFPIKGIINAFISRLPKGNMYWTVLYIEHKIINHENRLILYFFIITFFTLTLVTLLILPVFFILWMWLEPMKC